MLSKPIESNHCVWQNHFRNKKTSNIVRASRSKKNIYQAIKQKEQSKSQIQDYHMK